jgi:sulfane dehydrogenase subunit SoxC
MQVKWLHRLKLTATPAQTRFETATYTDLLPDGRAQQFVFQTRVKSVILKPSFGMARLQPGPHEISGIAWSHGEVTRVEVSSDRGKSWREAVLDGPGKAHALRRFRLPWRWDGAACVLMSRATNDAGDVQPLHSALVASRAPGQRYHFNAIQSWAIDASGAISNVYV